MTSSDLRRRLLREADARHPPVEEYATTRWNFYLYDSGRRDYTLLAAGDDNLNILERYGCRIRVRAVRLDSRKESTELLALEGRYYEKDFVNGQMRIRDGTSGREMVIAIKQDVNQTPTGATVWDGAILLAKFLEAQSSWVRDKHVVELGSGCGLVGITAAALGSRSVLLTDLEYCMRLLQINIDENRPLFEAHSSVECCECDWFQPTKHVIDRNRVDVILVADCVWLEELVEPLLSTLDAVLGAHPDAVALMSYQRRGKATDQAFWSLLNSRFRRVELLQEGNLKYPPSLSLIFCRR